MRIPRSLLDELTRDVNATSEAGRRMVEQALARLLPQFVGEDGSVGDVAGLRDAAIAIMEQSCSYLSDVSAGRAAEHYDAARAIQSPRHDYSASVMSGRDKAATEGAVRALVQKVVDGRTEAFVSGLSDRADYEVRRSANMCMALNAGRDPDKPRYCRVPSGSETCGFCLMLSSFGAHWTTPEAASHAHAGCDCRVEPDFGGMEVDGYDPDGMYGRYLELLDALGDREGIRAGWRALTDEDRDAYIRSHGGKEGDAFGAYLQSRIASEIEGHDPEWFVSGRHTRAEAEKRAWRLSGELLERASAHEPGVTEALRLLEIGEARLVGLEFRLKTRKSLARKLVSDAGGEQDEVARAAGSVSDVLRYTLSSPTASFFGSFMEARSSLESGGYRFLRVKNTLKIPDAPYRGVNAKVETPDGYVFELQFHTPESLEVKEENHRVYELARADDVDPEEARGLDSQMRVNSARVPTPPRIDEVRL